MRTEDEIEEKYEELNQRMSNMSSDELFNVASTDGQRFILEWIMEKKSSRKLFWLGISILIFTAVFATFVLVGYNFDTKFWYDKPYLDDSYYTFHPHEDDTCETLQSKFDLFHPKGTNPVRFEIMKEMFQKDCEVIIR